MHVMSDMAENKTYKLEDMVDQLLICRITGNGIEHDRDIVPAVGLSTKAVSSLKFSHHSRAIFEIHRTEN